jgi:hypothetical protein
VPEALEQGGGTASRTGRRRLTGFRRKLEILGTFASHGRRRARLSGGEG